jgi:hypothetical protein
MDLPYPRLLEINQRLKVITRAASDLLAQMEDLYALRQRLAIAQSSAGMFRRATEQEAIRNWRRNHRPGTAVAVRAPVPQSRGHLALEVSASFTATGAEVAAKGR